MIRPIRGRLVLATHNAGKLREMRELFAPYEVELVSAAELGLDEPAETGATFAANAAIKAEAACAATGLTAFADDSGLCVEALGGAPGVHSARWAKQAGSFEAAMDLLRDALAKAAEAPPFRAYFVSVLALASPGGGSTATLEGRVDGELVFPPRGRAGFGYDPIFKPDGLDCTFGEMSAQEKHGIPPDGSRALSHRARAFQSFAREFLENGMLPESRP